LDPTTPATSEATPASAPAAMPAPKITAWRFVGALLLASTLFFGLLVLFALTGLGIFGVVPALVVAMALTSRATKIRRMSVLILIGVLAFLIIVVGTYAIAVGYILLNPPAA